jgi:hypothetical protein
MKLLRLLPFVAVVLFAEPFGSANAQTGTTSNTREKVESMVKSKKLSYPDGRTVWYVESAGVSYEIPGNFVSTVGKSGVDIRIHWPSKRGIRDVPPDTSFSAVDVVNVFLAPLPSDRADDTYNVLKADLGRYSSRKSERNPSVVEYYSESKSGRIVVHYYSYADESARTPLGNPLTCKVIDPPDSPLARCSMYTRLGDGNGVTVRFNVKYVADLKQLHADVIKQIDSFRTR